MQELWKDLPYCMVHSTFPHRAIHVSCPPILCQELQFRCLEMKQTSADPMSTFVGRTRSTLNYLSGRVVLDTGCGMGRLTEVVSRKAVTVIGVDLRDFGT